MPPLVNRYYMIDLVPRQSFVKWLVDEGRTVFVISWVNPGDEHKAKDVGDYVVEGVVEAAAQVRKRTGTSPDLFAFCLGGTLVAIALAWLAAKGRSGEVNSATLIGSLVDFSDMRDWAAFVHESHFSAPGCPSGTARLSPTASSFSDCSRRCAPTTSSGRRWSIITSSTARAPPSDLLYWFEDGARIPAAFLKSYNRDLLLNNKLKEPAGFTVGESPIDLCAVETPILVIALKDDHVSAWEAVYQGARHLGADFVLGGSGHNAGGGSTRPPPTSTAIGPTRSSQLTKRNGSPPRTGTKAAGGRGGRNGSVSKGSGKTVAGRQPKDPIEPAPGRYVMMP